MTCTLPSSRATPAAPVVLDGGDDGVARSAAHLDDSWIGVDARRLLTAGLGREVAVLNAADAAGLAEARFDAARGWAAPCW